MRERARSVREFTLAIFASWLVLQNLVLLTIALGVPSNAMKSVVVALWKAAWVVLATVWMLPVAVLIAGVFMVFILRGVRQPQRWEVRHG